MQFNQFTQEQGVTNTIGGTLGQWLNRLTNIGFQRLEQEVLGNDPNITAQVDNAILEQHAQANTHSQPASDRSFTIQKSHVGIAAAALLAFAIISRL